MIRVSLLFSVCLLSNSFLFHKSRIHRSSKRITDDVEFRLPNRLLLAKSPLDDEDDIGHQSENYKSGFVSILGNPNVGKSTLMNALLGEKLSIVSPKPQTTRHRILGVYTQPNYQLVFSDTPGMVEPAYMLQEAMMESVRGAVGDADVIVLVTDVYAEPLVDERIFQKLSITQRPVIVAINKVDLLTGYKFEDSSNNTSSTRPQKVSRLFRRPKLPLPPQSPVSQIPPPSSPIKLPQDDHEKLLQHVWESFDEKSNPSITPSESSRSSTNTSTAPAWKIHSVPELRSIWAHRLPRASVIELSAKNGTGIERLLNAILEHIPKGPKYFPSDSLTDRDERFFTAEIVRETIFGYYKEEIPYSCEVIVDTFKDRSPTLSAIECTIMVNRDSQRLIIIGKGGLKLKEVGIAAREKLEQFLERKVYLSLRVKVDSDWRSKKDSLIRYGYIDDDAN